MFRTLLISLFLTSSVLADTWTVDDDGKADFDNIQAAIDASIDGDEIVVMPGTYTSTQDGHVVNMLGKAVTLRSSDPSDPDVVATTIIDGENTRRGLACFNEETNKTVIEGLTITNGFGVEFDYDGDGDIGALDNRGGGMHNHNSNPTLTNCTFENNTANYGGGMWNHFSTGNAAITNCTFENNTGTEAGCAMYNYNSNPTLTDCTFESNTGHYGTISNWNKTNNDPNSEPSLTNCIFKNNKITGKGSGIFNWRCNTTLTNCTFNNNTCNTAVIINAYSSPTLTDCTFANNNSFGYGGGVMSNNNDSNPTLIRCTFENNSAYTGAGMWNQGNSSPTLIECTFSNNIAKSRGGAIVNQNSNDSNDQCNPTITLCTFINNISGEEGGAIYSGPQSRPTLTDTHVCGNTLPQIYGVWTDSGGNYVFPLCKGDDDGDAIPDDIDNCYLYNPNQTDCNGNEVGDVCDVADGTSYDCNGNGEPDECDIVDGSGNDCNGNFVPDECDIADGTSTDLDENEIPDECECLSDINVDGIVNVSDVLIVIGYWGSTDSPADINFDGIVNVSDLLIVIDNWGACE